MQNRKKTSLSIDDRNSFNDLIDGSIFLYASNLHLKPDVLGKVTRLLKRKSSIERIYAHIAIRKAKSSDELNNTLS